MGKSRGIDSVKRLDDDGIRQEGMIQVCAQLAALVRRYPESQHSSEEQKQDLLLMLKTADRAEEMLGRDENSMAVRLIILGKLGRLDEAICLAHAAYDQAPTWRNAVAVANALRRKGDIEAAVAMLRVAARHDPKDLTALLDLGDLLLNSRQWGAALEGYEEALRREEDQPWALPSAHYCRYRVSGDGQWLDKLKALADEPPDECGVGDMLAQVFGGYAPDKRRQRANELLARLDREGSLRTS